MVPTTVVVSVTNQSMGHAKTCDLLKGTAKLAGMFGKCQARGYVEDCQRCEILYRDRLT